MLVQRCQNADYYSGVPVRWNLVWCTSRLYDNFLGGLRQWSDPKTLFVFVIHKHKFVICVCVAHFFRSKTNFGRHKCHSRLKKNLYWIHK